MNKLKKKICFQDITARNFKVEIKVAELEYWQSAF